MSRRTDGRNPSAIFSQESNLPLTIGLLVDTSMSQVRVLESERTASYKFLDQVLREDDTAFVFRFDFQVRLLQDFTSSRAELPAALSQLSRPQRRNTLLYDAIHDASECQMKQKKDPRRLWCSRTVSTSEAKIRSSVRSNSHNVPTRSSIPSSSRTGS
jgi:VWFA-related protein